MIDVSICICTFRRPAGILRLLRSLHALDRSSPPREIIVVDNDAAETGAESVRLARREGLDVEYVVEPVRGVARARNRSVGLARGEYVAFIDDDEEASPLWLTHLWGEVTRAAVDGGAGPIVPRFTDGVARWMIDGGFFERPRFPTGTVLGVHHTRTGNALIRRAALMSVPGPFDERHDFTGGEDTDLFARLMVRGHRFIAVDSAVVHEHVTPARTTMRWLLRRRFLGSFGAARLERRHPSFSRRRRPEGRWRGLRLLAAGLAWGTAGAVMFPARKADGFACLALGAQKLGRCAFLAGLSFRPYLDDSWR